MIRRRGRGFGTTTGRARRGGWVDAVAARYATRINRFDGACISLLDVLDGFEEVRICVAYELDGERLEYPPYERVEEVKPIYETLEGWDDELPSCRSREDLPPAAQRYIARIEQGVGCKVGVVSVGPDRQDTADLSDPFAS